MVAAIQQQVNVAGIDKALSQESVIRLRVGSADMVVTPKSKLHSSPIFPTQKRKRGTAFAVPRFTTKTSTWLLRLVDLSG